MVDLTLAALHFVLIFALVGILGAEAALVHEGMDGMQANRVAVLDRGYGAAAGLLLVVGLLRVFFGAKGAGLLPAESSVLGQDSGLRADGGPVDPAHRHVHYVAASRTQGARLQAGASRVRRMIVAHAAVLAAIPLPTGATAPD